MLDRLLDLLASAWHRIVPWIVINEYDRGVVLRLGQAHRTLEPGLHWVWPGLEYVLTDTVVTDTAMLDSQPVTSRDGVAVAIQPVLTYRVVDVRKLLLTVQDRERAVHDAAAGAIAAEVARSDWSELRVARFRRRVLETVRTRAARYGIEIEDVQFAGLAKARAYVLLHPRQGGEA